MNWFEFVLSTFIFLLFSTFIIFYFTNRVSSRLDDMKFYEMKAKATIVESILLFPEESEKFEEFETITQKTYYRVLMVDGKENQRKKEIVNFFIHIDENCEKNITKDSILIFDENATQVPFVFYEENYCGNGKIKNAKIIFFDSFNATRNYFIYYSCLNFTRETIFNSTLVGFWNFDEEGFIALDKTENKNHGEIIDLERVPGKFGMALNFSGQGFVNVSKGNNLSNEKTSIEFWVFITNFTEATIIEKYDSYGVKLENDKIKGYVVGLPSNYQPSFSIDQNKWHHIVFTSNGTLHNLYIDGSLRNSTEYEANIPLNVGPLSIGATYDGSKKFYGLIDEVRIYSHFMEEDEVERANDSKPINIMIYPETESKIISINKIKAMKNFDSSQIDRIFGFHNFYVEVGE
ncbi:MAG: LamG domain-containing protein [Candidatus Aenigmatarchaeota archaeon]